MRIRQAKKIFNDPHARHRNRARYWKARKTVMSRTFRYMSRHPEEFSDGERLYLLSWRASNGDREAERELRERQRSL